MNKVARIAHYASLEINGEEIYGIATLVAGGYSFRPDDGREVRLVSYKSSDLLLFGRCDIADAQWQEDTSTGDLEAVRKLRSNKSIF
jgi:hypothetical protein